MYLQYFYTNQTVAKTVIKAVPICNKKKWECPGSGNISQKKCCISVLRENRSSNFANVKNLEVADNTGASKTV